MYAFLPLTPTPPLYPSILPFQPIGVSSVVSITVYIEKYIFSIIVFNAETYKPVIFTINILLSISGRIHWEHSLLYKYQVSSLNSALREKERERKKERDRERKGKWVLMERTDKEMSAAGWDETHTCSGGLTPVRAVSRDWLCPWSVWYVAGSSTYCLLTVTTRESD